MEYNLECSNKVMNKIFYSITDKYGWENEPYVYNKSTKIEIPMWRYSVNFINLIIRENNIIIDKITKDDIIFLDSYNDYYNIKD